MDEIKKWIQKFEHSLAPNMRLFLLSELRDGRLKKTEDKEAVVDVLIKALEKDKNLEVRKEIVLTLGVIGGRKADDALIEALKDKNENPNVRRLAAELLGRIRDKRAVPELIRVLKDKNENPDVREAVAWALGEIGDERAVKPLIEAFKDTEASMRLNVAEALVKIGELAVPELIKALRNENPYVQVEAVKVLIEIGEPAVPILIKALLKDGYLVVRMWAAYALGEICALGKTKDESVVNALREASLKDEDPEMCKQAAKALRKIEKSQQALEGKYCPDIDMQRMVTDRVTKRTEPPPSVPKQDRDKKGQKMPAH